MDLQDPETQATLSIMGLLFTLVIVLLILAGCANIPDEDASPLPSSCCRKQKL
jgi:hypothetical protein